MLQAAVEVLSVLGAKFGLKLKKKTDATAGAFGVSPPSHRPPLLEDGPPLPPQPGGRREGHRLGLQ